MSDNISDFHVAQQSRKERLRIISNSADFDIFHQYRNVSPYDPSLVLSSSEMINFATTSSTNDAIWKNNNVDSSAIWSNVSNNNNNSSVQSMYLGGYNEMPATNLSTSNIEFGVSNTPVVYHDTLQEVVTSATSGGVGCWTESYIDQSRIHALDNNSSGQGLALSLSPVVPQSFEKKGNNVIVPPENFAIAHRCAVPLGPFTGYATILKSSKFLRPAQQLLDELCELATGSSSSVLKCSSYTKRIRDGFRVSSDFNAIECSSGGCVGESNGLNEPCVRPEYLQKKAKLIIMQDEIRKRYKQYHQQMQMVVSSFETVAGLSAATPYIFLALKTVSQHFKSLRNAITDHLKSIRQALGENLLPSPASGNSNKGVDGNSSRLKLIDQTIRNQKSGGGGSGVTTFFESQQHVWRPQRGLPERAVAVLRAWLFDHFLHPYPTDSDKHMLASQTGLTRNQVSNWFINARVRVWKPMVEEIHMLETKGSIGDQTGSNIRKPDLHKLVNARTKMAENRDNCQNTNGSSDRLDSSSDHMWRNQEKRSRIEYHNIPPQMDGSMMGFVPYNQRNGLEIGGSTIGPVSLTLGLRQNAEAAQQQQLQLHEHRFRQQFGGHMIHHDFVD